MNANDLQYGIEIETIAPDSAVRNEHLRIGAYHHGIQVPYLPAGWTAENDGSINNGHGGHRCEIVSPVLKGPEGLAQVAEVAGILESKGHTVNASCGVHYEETVVMWSRSHLAREYEGFCHDQLHITFCLVGLQGTQPVHELLIRSPRWQGCCRCERGSLLQSLARHLQVGAGVDRACLDVGVAEDCLDRRHRVAGLQQVHRLRVSQHVRADPGRQVGSLLSRLFGVLRKEIAHAGPRETMAIAVEEQRFIQTGILLKTMLAQIIIEQHDRFGHQRYNLHLASLAGQPNLRRGRDAHVANAQVNYLLYPRKGTSRSLRNLL